MNLKLLIMTTIMGFSLASYAQESKPESDKVKPEPEITPLKAEKTVIKPSTPYVPDGTIVVNEKTQLKVRSANDTLVEIFLDADGKLERGSGGMIEKDAFNPGDGMLDLKAAVNAAKKFGKDIAGQWAFEKDTREKWVYEFEGKITEMDESTKKEIVKEIEIAIDAKSGRLMSEEADE